MIEQFLGVAASRILSINPSFAQIKKYRFSSDMCEYETTYGSRQYSLQQIKNTLYLSNFSQSMNLFAEDQFYSTENPPMLKKNR